jgi:hypothetical protein
MAEGDRAAAEVGPRRPERFAEPAGVQVADAGPGLSPEALDVLESQGVDAWLDWTARR